MDIKKITKRENTLIRREPYYRRVRRGSAIAGCVAALGAAASFFFGNGNHPSLAGMLLLAVLAFGMAYESHLRIRHIESIHYHRGKHEEIKK